MYTQIAIRCVDCNSRPCPLVMYSGERSLVSTSPPSEHVRVDASPATTVTRDSRHLCKPVEALRRIDEDHLAECCIGALLRKV